MELDYVGLETRRIYDDSVHAVILALHHAFEGRIGWRGIETMEWWSRQHISVGKRHLLASELRHSREIPKHLFKLIPRM